MKIKLINYSPNPELLVALAARLCQSDISASKIQGSLSNEHIERILNVIFSSGHLSVVEHINFTFGIDGVSRVLTHQLVRHRVGVAFSQQSQRYTMIKKPNYIMPPTISSNPMLRREFDKLVKSSFFFYRKLQEEGIPIEDARFVFPQAIATRILMTVNMRQLIHMYNINACFKSQWEFRRLMLKIKQEVRKVSLRLANELKIKCFTIGYCDETKMCKELETKMPRRKTLLKFRSQYTQQFYEDLARQVGEY